MANKNDKSDLILAKNSDNHNIMANAIRSLSIDAVERAKSGHPGMPMGMADVATVLFRDFLRHNPEDPKWSARDRFILSAGHGSMLLYSLLYLTGYKDINIEEIKNFRQLGSKAAGHPEYGELAAIETTTGPLGQGLANAVGMAVAERLVTAEFGELFSHNNYVIVGDGCLMEGISHESISFAGHHKLGKLIVLFDDNEISIDGKTSLSVSDDMVKRFEASGFHTQSIDGHDESQIKKAIKLAKEDGRPSLIACKTIIGLGSPNKQGTSATHGSPLGAEEAIMAKENLGINYPAFELPKEVISLWHETTKNSESSYKKYQEKYSAMPDKAKSAYEALFAKKNISAISSNIVEKIKSSSIETEATRQSSGNFLDEIFKNNSELSSYLIGGSADLTGSNNTKTSTMTIFNQENPSGSYIYYGVREHAMGAIMNGIALHGEFIAYGGSFLVFSDYMRPAIRLAALMKLQTIYIMTHDSIGLGEDGPTHQPVEHFASLRAIPNLLVMRPADKIETAECWQIALQHSDKPSVLGLTRQKTRQIRSEINKGKSENLCAKGAYFVHGDENSQIRIFATGSELGIAFEAMEILQNKSIEIAIISVPCFELFREQSEDYRQKIIGKKRGDSNKIIRIAIEAGIIQGWHEIIGEDGIFIGMENFGASAPAVDLYNHFNITAENLVNNIITMIEKNSA